MFAAELQLLRPIGRLEKVVQLVEPQKLIAAVRFRSSLGEICALSEIHQLVNLIWSRNGHIRRNYCSRCEVPVFVFFARTK